MHIEFKGLKQTIQRFLGIGQKMNNPKIAVEKIAILGWKNVLNHFDTEQDSEGASWPRWKYKGARVATRPTKRGGSKLLQDTGRLRGSVYYKTSGKSAIVFIKLKYAATHNYGDSARNIDKRQFMYLDQATKDQIKDTYVKLVLKK